MRRSAGERFARCTPSGPWPPAAGAPGAGAVVVGVAIYVRLLFMIVAASERAFLGSTLSLTTDWSFLVTSAWLSSQPLQLGGPLTVSMVVTSVCLTLSVVLSVL